MENREASESITFEEKTFNKGIAESASFDVISTLDSERKNDIHSEEKPIKNISRFIEMPLQLNSSIRISKSRQPQLTLDDRGYKNENFRNYEIGLIDEKGEKKLKCFRRFSNFDAFHQKLCQSFPYLIIPNLPKKNYKVKLMTLEEQFYSNRAKSLRGYINFLFRHEEISSSQELYKFLNDAEFDEKFYNLDNVAEQFPESDKASKLSISSQIYGYFTGFFKSKEYSRMPFQEESQFHKHKQHFEIIRDKMKEMKKKIKAYVVSLSCEHKCLEEFSNNFLYIREVNFSSFEGKDYFTQGSDLLLDLGKVNLKYYLEEGESLLEKASAFCSLLKGVCDAFIRWEEFLKLFEKVDKANHIAKSHPKSFNSQGLSKEHDKIIGIKTNFIKRFQKELSNFCSENKNMFSSLTENFKNLINAVNSQEKNKLSHLRESLCLD